jgi:hypothetical protein
MPARGHASRLPGVRAIRWLLRCSLPCRCHNLQLGRGSA